MSEKVRKTDTEWRQQLTPEQYYVTRQKGTEPAFTGKHNNAKGEGVYRCVCCGADLYSVQRPSLILVPVGLAFGHRFQRIALKQKPIPATV